jgi:hypothetical protein
MARGGALACSCQPVFPGTGSRDPHFAQRSRTPNPRPLVNSRDNSGIGRN